MSWRTLHLANWITISRFVACFFLILLILTGNKSAFSWILLLAFLTDAADGFVARNLTHISVFGSRLDSAADALLFSVAAAGIVKFEPEFILHQLPLVITALAFYFLKLGIAYFKYGKPSSFHTYMAKIAAIIQGSFFLATFFFEVWEWLFYLTVVTSMLETLEEIALIFILPKWKVNVRGIYQVLKNKK